MLPRACNFWFASYAKNADTSPSQTSACLATRLPKSKPSGSKKITTWLNGSVMTLNAITYRTFMPIIKTRGAV